MPWVLRTWGVTRSGYSIAEGLRMSKQSALGVFLFLLVFQMSVPVPTHGQLAVTGVVLGTVTDPSGAVVVGATVALKDTMTWVERTTITNDAGRYNIPNVPPGTYNITISKTGFRQTIFSDQKVVVAESRSFDVQQELGASTEVV